MGVRKDFSKPLGLVLGFKGSFRTFFEGFKVPQGEVFVGWVD